MPSREQDKKLSISILIPCHNEEQMVAACVDSCLSQTRPLDQIIIVDDGSTDRSAEVLASYGDRITVVTVPIATGNKSYAQEIGMRHITSDVFIATDGDTILDKEFVAHIERRFLTEPEIVAVSGYVKSLRYNWLTAIREIDYTIGQDLHKRAQSYLQFLLVIPGCAGAFKTDIFRKYLGFDHDTLTEDLDTTYKLHRAGLKIAYETRAVSYTQDPPTIGSYTNQMRRWYGGGWQCLRKHIDILKQPRIAFELSLTYIDGLVFSALFFVLPVLNFLLFLQMLAINVLVMLGLGAYAAIRRRRVDLFLYSPLSLVIVAVNAWLFIEQCLVEMLMRQTNLVWFHPERRIMTSRV